MNLTPPIKISPLSPPALQEKPPPDGTEWRCACGGDLFGIWRAGVLHVKYKEREMMADGTLSVVCRRCGNVRSVDTRTGVPINVVMTSDDDYLENLKTSLTVSVNVVDATEAAIKLAQERGIDLGQVKGTGKDGRVTRGDVEALIFAGGLDKSQ